MSKILLLIKAETFEQAKSAAKSRKIHATDLCHMNKNEFRARTETSNIVSVQKWYNENDEKDVIHKYGFPIGTLLFFKLED
jgi:hypothetical protein